MADRIRGTPIHIFHDGRDERVSVDQSRRLAAALKKVGADVHYTEYPDTDHGGAADKAYADSTLFAWVLTKSRQPAGGGLSRDLLYVIGEHAVNQSLIPHVTPFGFLSKTLKNIRIQPDSDELSGPIANRRAARATHGPQSFI